MVYQSRLQVGQYRGRAGSGKKVYMVITTKIILFCQYFWVMMKKAREVMGLKPKNLCQPRNRCLKATAIDFRRSRIIPH
jgi:hypothetical protein